MCPGWQVAPPALHVQGRLSPTLIKRPRCHVRMANCALTHTCSTSAQMRSPHLMGGSHATRQNTAWPHATSCFTQRVPTACVPAFPPLLLRIPVLHAQPCAGLPEGIHLSIFVQYVLDDGRAASPMAATHSAHACQGRVDHPRGPVHWAAPFNCLTILCDAVTRDQPFSPASPGCTPQGFDHPSVYLLQ
jgi:hypothetical protein